MQTSENLMSELIDKASSGKHTQFRFLRTWREYSDTKKLKLFHELLIKSIKKSGNRLLNKYCKSIVKGNRDIISLMAYATTLNILKFYEEELDIILDMLDEYEAYLASGNFLNAFLFLDFRSSSELWDHRR